MLVPAACLTGRTAALHDTLAAAVSADLSDMGLADRLPAEFFQLEPRPGIPWLLLVDGFDEIADPASRWQVQSTITWNSHDTVSPYRFIMAVRSPQSAKIGWNIRDSTVYWLQPFAPADLKDFAERWFTSIGSPGPADMALAFTNALKQAHLTELACTPIVGTMLCQLYVAAPSRQLPSGRSEIYLQFTELLHNYQHEAGVSVKTIIALRRHGEHATAQARRTFDHLRPLLTSLAVQRRAGNNEPALDLLAKQSAATCPEHVPQQLWTKFLSEILQQSGLITSYAGDFTFLHQTFIDYLAAGEVAADEGASAQQYANLFKNRWADRRSGKFEKDPSGKWTEIPLGGGKVWNPPDNDDSFLGFLLDAWHDTPADPAQALRRVAASGGSGCRFITSQARLGARLPAFLITAAADALARSARDQANPLLERRLATEALIAVGDSRGHSILTAMADDPDSRDRDWAAGGLAALGDSHGRDVLIDMATGSTDRFWVDPVGTTPGGPPRGYKRPRPHGGHGH